MADLTRQDGIARIPLRSRAGAFPSPLENSNQVFSVLAQASSKTRGRGAGRRFTKATAAGAAAARSKNLSSEQCQDIARRAAAARWGKAKGGGDRPAA